MQLRSTCVTQFLKDRKYNLKCITPIFDSHFRYWLLKSCINVPFYRRRVIKIALNRGHELLWIPCSLYPASEAIWRVIVLTIFYTYTQQIIIRKTWQWPWYSLHTCSYRWIPANGFRSNRAGKKTSLDEVIFDYICQKGSVRSDCPTLTKTIVAYNNERHLDLVYTVLCDLGIEP